MHSGGYVVDGGGRLEARLESVYNKDIPEWGEGGRRVQPGGGGGHDIIITIRKLTTHVRLYVHRNC